MENNRVAIYSGLFLFGAVMAFILVPMAFSADTIFLTTKEGGTPVSCAPANGLVLAQNLTDLCDVVIISPATNQTLVYNGSYWVNTNQVVFNDTSTCTNIGSGSAFICVEGTNIDFRSILASTGISVSNSSNTITITNTAPDNTVCANVGAGSQIYKDGECNFRTLTTGTGISLAQNTNDVQITNSLPENTVCAEQATGVGLCINDDITLKNLVAGSSISITSNTTHITITNSKPEQGCTSAGGTSIWKTTTTCDAKGLTAGVGLTLTSNTNDNNYKTNFVNGTGVTITGTGTQTFSSHCNNTGSGEAVCESSNNINSLIGSGGITITDTTGDLTINPTWELLCTNSGSGSSLNCSSFTARKQLFVQIEYRTVTNTMVQGIRFNSDSGTNYSTRSSSNGGADSTGTSLAQCTLRGGGSFSTNDRGIQSYWVYNNQSGDRKLMMGNIIAGADTSAGTAPVRVEQTCKWDNTANQITSIQLMIVSGSGTYDTGTEITVWGYD